MEYGRYRIVRELGRGAMGVVYQAHDPQIDRMVALKVLRPDRVTSEDFVGRFLKEARAIGRLLHPRIVTIFDVGNANGTVFIAMEYLDGESLKEVIGRGGLTPAGSVEIACQVAEALDYAHSQGIVHRDIKPSNIILTRSNQVKLTDFGIARIEDSAAGIQTQAGEILGTPLYMSPEQVAGRVADGRSDLYALGVILYEMIVGRRPFGGDNIAAVLRSITLDDPEPPIAADPSLSASLSDLVMKCLAKNPEDRFQSGQQMADALLAAQRQPAQAPAVSAPTEATRSSMVIRPWLAGLAALLVMTAAGAYIVVGRHSGPAEHAPAETALPPVATAVLQLSSAPAGAQVYVGSIFQGLTPLDIPLRMGKHELRLNLPDHLIWEAQIELDTQGVTPVHIELQPTN